LEQKAKAIQTKVCIAFVFLYILYLARITSKIKTMKAQITKDTFETVLDKTLRVRRIINASGKDKPTIVFLHEALGCIELWKNFPDLVAKETGHNVMIYERQGHGASSSLDLPRPLDYLEIEAQEYLPQLLEQLGIKRPILIGHSDGATIALIYTALYPVSMLLTAAAHVLVEEITIEGVGLAAESYHKNNICKKLEKYHGTKAHDLFWAWADTWLNPAFKAWNVRHFLSKIHCPVLLIQGKEDEFATLDQQDLIAKEIGSLAQTIVLENCGHSPHIQAKDSFLEGLCEFIKINRNYI
jgi:pimeloyl-ACP methyl ester carboxylesterase